MIKVFEAFAGYGSQAMALRRLGIDFEVVGISEIDKYAIQAYMAVHGETPNYGDISKIDWSSVPDFDFLTYSFPCTDISTAGQQKGLAEGSGTRSSLLWECRKAIEAKRPKYLLMENVKNLVSKKFTPYLKEWLRFLEGQGYSNYTKVLNAKDFGVPQNRERVFMVSILGEASFHFPKPFTLEKRLKDVLEKDVDESFYLSEKIVKTFLARNEKNKAKGNGFKFEPTMGDVITSSILTHPNDRPCDNYVYVVQDKSPISCALRGRNPENPSDRKAGIELEQTLELGTDIANCITTVQKDSLVAEPLNVHDDGCCRTIKANYYKVAGSDILDNSDEGARFKATGVIEYIPSLYIKQATKKGYIEIPPGGVFDASYPESLTRRGRVQDNGSVSLTLTAGGEPPCLYEGMEPKCVAYTRDCKGKVISRRLSDIANTVHGSTGNGGNTDCFVAEPKIIQVCNLVDEKGFKNPQRGRVYNPIGISPNINTMGGGNLEPKIIEDFTNYRIRKLTPRECFRLMGVSEKDIDNIQKSGISKTQQYKMAGNSIVVDVLYYIFKKMFVDKSCEDAQLSLF